MESPQRAWSCPHCGVAMVEQPLTPHGIATGGQSATSERAESGDALRPLDGSFLFPPVLNTAEDILDF